ncbi:MAG: NAD(P)H-binding protein [Flavobacteriales bacterium]
MGKTILVAGATGLIGSTVLQQALADPCFERVIAVVRTPLPQHPGLEQWLHTDLLQALRPQRVDAVLCCLGTTIGKEGGDQTKFIHVDKELVVGLGRWAKAQGVPVMSVVSAIGADASSRVFYNRVKGEMEAAMKALGLPTLHLFQPSILTGPRKEVRVGERIGIAVARVLAPLLPARYRPMPHDVLAAALLRSVDRSTSGTYDNAAIRAL